MPIVVVDKLVDQNVGLSEQLLSVFGSIGLLCGIQ